MASSAPERRRAPLAERVATRPRFSGALLVLATLLDWGWLATRPMSMAPSLPAATLMWSVMMAAMMLPAASPAVLLFGRVAARERGACGSSTQFVAGYLVVWSLFSILAAVAQVLATRAGHLDAMSLQTGDGVAALLWLAAGGYQLSPLKRACLAQCRSPAVFFARDWRPGPLASLRLGMRHGLFCIGCCGALMALLFVGGAMNLRWAVMIAALVAVEKVAPHGDRIGRVAGVAMIGWAALALLL